MFKYNQIENFRNNNLRFQKSLTNFKTTLFRKSTPFSKQKSDYLLYAKSLLSQLLQEQQLGLLKPDFLELQQLEIFKALKKCSTVQKHEIAPQLVRIHTSMNIEIKSDHLNHYLESLKYLHKLKNDQEKFVDLITFQRIDIFINYMSKKVSEIDEREYQRICQELLQQLQELTSIMEKKMTKNEFSSFLRGLSIWGKIKKERKLKKKSEIISIFQRTSKEKTASDKSDSSRNSNGYLQRLQIFLAQAKSQAFQKQLKEIEISRRQCSRGRNSKRLINRKSIKMMNTTKRVSNTWSKEEINIRHKTPISQNKQNHKKSIEIKLREVVQKIFQDTQDINLSQTSRQESEGLALSNNSLEYEMFYIFAVINKKLMTISVRIFEVKRIKDFIILGIEFIGYICQKMNLKVQISEIQETFEDSHFKSLIIQHCQIIKHGLGYKIREKLKIDNLASEEVNGSIIRKNHQIQQEIFGFIKRFNVYFFAKILQKGKLLIYDTFFDRLLEERITPNIKLSFFNTNFQTVNQNGQKDTNVTDKLSVIKSGIKKFTTSSVNITNLKGFKKSKTKKLKSMGKTSHFLDISNSELIDIVRINRRNQFIKYEYLPNQSLKLYNRGLSGSNKGITKLQIEGLGQSISEKLQYLRKKFKNLNQTSISGQKITKVSIRSQFSSFSKILMKFTFTKLVKSKFFIIFKILVFSIDSPLVFIDAYIPKFQKVYQFDLDKTSFFQHFQIKDTENYNEVLKIVTKKIKIKIKVGQQNIHKFILSLENAILEGRQVLIRKFHSQNNNKNECLQTISMSNSQKIGRSITFKRQIYRLSPQFRNYICENFTISSAQLFTDFKYLDYELILKLKESSETKNSVIRQFIKGQSPQCTYKIVKYKHSKKIIRINLSQPYKLTHFSLNSHERQHYLLDEKFIKEDPIASKLKNQALLRYLGRQIKNFSTFRSITKNI